MLSPDARILVVAAHADDEAIGCGGLLMAHPGPKRVIICTEPGGVRKQEMTVLNCLKSASDTGDYSYCILPFEDQKLDTVNQIDVNVHIERIIESFKPDVILTHSSHDNNTDHQFVHKSVNIAARFVKNLFYFRIPSPGEFPGFEGRVTCPIIWEKKERLLRCYDFEMRPYPHPRSYEALKSNYEQYEIGRMEM